MADPRTMRRLMLRDRDWVRNSFATAGRGLGDSALRNRFFTTSSLKFTDTTPGGSFSINTFSQANPLTDPRQPQYLSPFRAGSPVSRYRGGGGMGRFYSESIDDNSQLVHFRFGVPSFNSLIRFFTGFYSAEAGVMVKTGRAPNAFFRIGQTAGYVTAVLNWPLLATTALGNAVNFFLERQTSKYYYHKGTMPMYWSTVQTLVNQMAVYRGIAPRVVTTLGDTEKTQATSKFTNQAEFSQADIEMLRSSKFGKDIFTSTGSVNVYALANRAQRASIAMMEAANREQDSALNNLRGQYERISNRVRDGVSTLPDFSRIMGLWLGTKAGGQATPGESSVTAESFPTDEKGEYVADVGFSEFSAAELEDGSAFVTFRVNNTGTASDSFTNSTQEAPIKSSINASSASARTTAFNFAGGNLVGGTGIGDLVQGAVGAATSTVAGYLDGVSLSGIMALAGNAYTDIPDMWSDSSATLNASTYTIDLVPPSNNPLSHLLKVYIPLACLLAGALPRATGRASYGPPYICQYYDRGRAQSRLGIISQLSVERGTTNTGFDQQGRALGVRVSFTVKELSQVVYMPTTAGPNALQYMAATAAGVAGAVGGTVAGSAVGAGAGGLAGAAGAAVGGAAGAAAGGASGALLAAGSVLGIFSEDTLFSDYMNVITGTDLYNQYYVLDKLKRNLTVAAADFDTWFSQAHWASVLGDTLGGRLTSAIFHRGTGRGSAAAATGFQDAFTAPDLGR